MVARLTGVIARNVTISLYNEPASPVIVDFSSPNIGLQVMYDSGGGTAEIAPDPINASIDTVKVVKKSGDNTTYFGTSITGTNIWPVLPDGNTTVYMDVYSPYPGANIVISLSGGTGINSSSEVGALTTVTNAWETIPFVLPNPGTFSTIVIYPESGVSVGSDTPFYFNNLTFPGAIEFSGGGTFDRYLPLQFFNADENSYAVYNMLLGSYDYPLTTTSITGTVIDSVDAIDRVAPINIVGNVLINNVVSADWSLISPTRPLDWIPSGGDPDPIASYTALSLAYKVSEFAQAQPATISSWTKITGTLLSFEESFLNNAAIYLAYIPVVSSYPLSYQIGGIYPGTMPPGMTGSRTFGIIINGPHIWDFFLDEDAAFPGTRSVWVRYTGPGYA